MNTIPLGEIIAAAKLERAGDGQFEVLSMTRGAGLVRQDGVFKKSVASRDLTKYKIVRPNQLVVGIHIDEGALGMSRTDQVGIVSPAYTLWDLIAPQHVNSEYLDRFLRSPLAIQYFIAHYRKTADRRGKLTRDRFLELPVPLPPIEEQRRLADVLDKADALRTKRRQALDKLDTLTKSIFIDMFGDPVTNPLGFTDDKTLADVATASSGITKGRKVKDEPLHEVPYLAVANVQDGALAMEPLKMIGATQKEIARYALAEGDLVLTEGGDPDKLGRGAIWRGEHDLCLHQNHIFRVRLTSDAVTPEYLSHLISSPRGKRYFLRMAKQTTGIASINMTQLRRFPVLVPPRSLQDDFVRRTEALASVLRTVERASSELDTLFASLQQRAFAGEL